VAEGSPEALKEEIGRPSVEAIPADPRNRERVASVLGRFGSDRASSPRGVAVRLDNGGDLAGVVRALDQEGLEVEQIELHQPTLDDVFLAKTGRSLEGAGEAQEETGEVEAAAEPARA
jgi:ABC-2 type transport system ATP-binding protein